MASSRFWTWALISVLPRRPSLRSALVPIAGEAATIFAIDPPLPDDDGVYITIRLTNGATRSTTAAHVTVVPAASTPKKPKVKAKSKSPRTRAKQSPGVLSGDEDDDDNGDDISSLTVAELKRRLAAAGQDATGKRIELVARLAKCTGVELDDSAAKKGRKVRERERRRWEKQPKRRGFPGYPLPRALPPPISPAPVPPAAAASTNASPAGWLCT